MVQNSGLRVSGWTLKTANSGQNEAIAAKLYMTPNSDSLHLTAIAGDLEL
jgi:hypothetical protein